MVGETSSYVEADASCGSIALADQLHLSETLAPSVAVPTVVLTVTLNSSGPITIAEKIEIKRKPMPDTEMVYGTYDEASNCITIIYPEEDATWLSPISQQQQPHLLNSLIINLIFGPIKLVSRCSKTHTIFLLFKPVLKHIFVYSKL